MPDAGIKKLDTEAMLATLKPFQRDTVEYVFRRMYTDPDCTRRFLVADEVGLGKTMVAQGVIARAVDHLQGQVDRIDIVYICSNADIARQNLQRLNLTDDRGAAQVGRLTMLPALLPTLDAHLNFVAFTPGTSFHMGSRTGTWQERAVLFWMLEDMGRLPTTTGGNPFWDGAPQLLQAGVEDLRRWKDRLWERHLAGIGPVKIDPTLRDRFEVALDDEAQQAAREGRFSLQGRIDRACPALKGQSVHRATPDLWHETLTITGELRRLLARSCLSALKPDLVILDEFQRFKELMDPDDEAGALAHDLFDYADDHTAVRTLLLSATPYKMYTLHSEQAEDDHYRDFMDTLGFLFNDDEQTEAVRDLLKRMRRSLYRIPSVGPGEALECRRALEERMRKVMARSERARGTDEGDDMVREMPEAQPSISAEDTRGYLGLQRMVRAINGPDMIEYWKSAPYLLNFMDEYQVKRHLRDAIKVGGNASLSQALEAHQSLLLSNEAVTAYQELDPGNGRLRMLLDAIVSHGLWRMLWMPPSLQPYRLDGAYAEIGPAVPTKRLIFSAWQVVPKTIAALVSYEIERRVHLRHDDTAENTKKARERDPRLLRLTLSHGQPTGLPIFTLIYPSSVLARIGGEALAETASESGDNIPAREAVLDRAESKVEAMLPPAASESREGRVDESWYWVTPILLDLADEPQLTYEWWNRQDLAWQWTRDEREADAFGWNAHLERAWEVVQGDRPTGPAPTDLARLLAEVAIGSPATSGLRSLRAVTGCAGSETPTWLRDGAARIGWNYRRLFNQVESTMLIRAEYQAGSGTPYWRQVLTYGLDGGLTAVNDEYLHVLAEKTGAGGCEPDKACERVVKAFEAGVALPASWVEWDEVRFDASEPSVRSDRTLRTHFAARFGQAKSEDGGTTREDQVRAAFNSPFWPFVLASTSVGQEGLDFHPYCHAIVHWNLPGNPVDMEQREGRIHRYKGHAVRKNLAGRFQYLGRSCEQGDRWAIMFDRAREQQDGAGRGLVPDWNYPTEDGARIERHVPVLPLSRDARRYERLRKSLAAYRMVFGQARQEDLVAYLLEHVGPERVEGLSDELRIDLAPPQG